MNVKSQVFSSNRNYKTFNNSDRFIEGWYWVIPSIKLQVGEVKTVTILGKKLIFYRGTDKIAVSFDACCQYMEAHFAEGNEFNCCFHQWKFNTENICVDIPCLNEPLSIKLKTWPTAEKYGIIWVWTGEVPQQPLPFVPELEQKECDVVFSSHFVINCHPNVMLINTIDAQHFNTVHKLPLKIIFEKQKLHQNAITFSNTTPISKNPLLLKFIHLLSKNAVTYSILFWYGSTGIVTIGPDFLHLHIMFTLRLLEEGKTEGQTLLMIKKRQGIIGWLFNQFVLHLINIVGRYFIQGDTKIFQTIKFNLRTPIKADLAIMQFINHVEKQKTLIWGTWQEASRCKEKSERRFSAINRTCNEK